MKKFQRARVNGGSNNDSFDTCCGTKNFLCLLHIRAASLYTSARAARGRPDASTLCKAGCWQQDDLSHRIQVCSLGARLRTQSHNIVTKKCAAVLKEQSYHFWLEPHIPTSLGYRIPYLVATNETHISCLIPPLSGTKPSSVRIMPSGKSNLIRFRTSIKSPGLCARPILDREKPTSSDLFLTEMTEYWGKGIFEHPSVPDTRDPLPISLHSNIADPITL